MEEARLDDEEIEAVEVYPFKLGLHNKNKEWVLALEQMVYEVGSQVPPPGPYKVFDHLYWGNATVAADLDLLKQHKITHVVNLCGEACSIDYSTMKIRTLLINALDSSDYDMTQHIKEVYNFVESARIAGRRVYLHCQAGVNRSGFLITAYVMMHKNMPLVAAIKYCLKRRGMYLTNDNFLGQIVRWAREREMLVESGKPQSACGDCILA